LGLGHGRGSALPWLIRRSFKGCPLRLGRVSVFAFLSGLRATAAGYSAAARRGDYPPNFIAAWKSFAKQKHIILIAPELPRIDTFERVAPAVFKCVVEDTKMQAAIDPRRVYVVGHSMGGILPMTLPPSIPNTSPQSLSTPWGLPMNTNQS
jgi:hypothetical protein